MSNTNTVSNCVYTWNRCLLILILKLINRVPHISCNYEVPVRSKFFQNNFYSIN